MMLVLTEDACISIIYAFEDVMVIIYCVSDATSLWSSSDYFHWMAYSTWIKQ